jgi:hypothetical protein
MPGVTFFTEILVLAGKLFHAAHFLLKATRSVAQTGYGAASPPTASSAIYLGNPC